MTALVALPLIATWTVVVAVVAIPSLLIWAACAAGPRPDLEREADIEGWLDDLLVDFREPRLPEQRTPIHDNLAAETFRRQLDEGRQA